MWRDARVVDQLRPQGATETNYQNGIYNCAGAVAATFARMLGTRPGESDAQLITNLSRGRTTPEGTTPRDLVNMIEEVGGRVNGTPIVGSYSDRQLNKLFSNGNKLVAQVGLHNTSTNTYDPHYVIVDGVDRRGNYRIKDPLGGEYMATPSQLRQAIYRSPGAGGMLIPIAPANPGPAPTRIGSGMGLASVAPQPPQPFATDSSRVAGLDPTFRTDGFDIHPRFSLTDTRANDALLGGVGGRSTWSLNRQPTSPTAPQHVPRNTTPEEFARNILNMLRITNPSSKSKGRELLDLLKVSTNPTDQKAFSFILNKFSRQPGIGQRVGYNGYGG